MTETDDSNITIGNNVFIGTRTLIDCVQSVMIEDDVLISWECVLADSNNHSLSRAVRRRDLQDWRNGGKHDWRMTGTEPIRVAKGAWIGMRVIILKGVTIGEGAVVAAGSVVTNDIPSWTVVGGNPARILKEIPKDEQ